MSANDNDDAYRSLNLKLKNMSLHVFDGRILETSIHDIGAPYVYLHCLKFH